MDKVSLWMCPMSGSWSQPGVLGICRAVQGQLQDREALWGQLILHRSLSGQRTPALEGRGCLLPGREAPLQAVRVLFFFFALQVPALPCFQPPQGCPGLCVVLAKDIAGSLL